MTEKDVRVLLLNIFDESRDRFKTILKQLLPTRIKMNNIGWIYFEYEIDNVRYADKKIISVTHVQGTDKINVYIVDAETYSVETRVILSSFKMMKGVEYVSIEETLLKYLNKLLKEIKSEARKLQIISKGLSRRK